MKIHSSSSSAAPSNFIDPVARQIVDSKDSKAQSIRKTSLKNSSVQGIRDSSLLNWQTGVAIGAAGLAAVAAISVSRYFSGEVPRPPIPPTPPTPPAPPIPPTTEVPPPPIPQNCQALLSNLNNISKELISLMPDLESARVSPLTISAVVGMLFAGMSYDDQGKCRTLLKLPDSMSSSDCIACLGIIAQQLAGINEDVLKEGYLKEGDPATHVFKNQFLDSINSYKTKIKAEVSDWDLILRSKRIQRTMGLSFRLRRCLQNELQSILTGKL